MTSVSDFHATGVSGEDVPLARFAGQVLLIVNTASRCGFTPQYKGLEGLHRAYRQRGFSVLGFPCNQFGAQEPGSGAEISEFCRTRYDVTFPLFAKIEVNGPRAHPLYGYLTRACRGLFGTRGIKWNFTKFLIDRDGRPVARFAPRTRPDKLESAIGRLL